MPKVPAAIFAAMRSIKTTRWAGGPRSIEQVFCTIALVKCCVAGALLGWNRLAAGGIGENARRRDVPERVRSRIVSGGVGTSGSGGSNESSESLMSVGVDGAE